MHSIYVADESLIPEIEINLKKPHRIAHYLWVRDLGLFWSLWIETKQLHFFFSSHRRRKWTLAKAKNFCRWRRANCWGGKKKIKEPVQIFIFWSAGYQKNSRGRCKNKLSPLQSLYCQSHVSCVARLWRMREIFHGLCGSIFRRNEVQFNRVYHVTLRTCVPCKSGTG